MERVMTQDGDTLPQMPGLRLPFVWKIGLTVSIFTLAIAGCCLYCYFYVVSKALIGQIGEYLVDVGRASTVLFDNEARAAIRELTEATDNDTIVTRDQLETMAPNTTMSSLTPEDIDRFQSSQQFKLLLRIVQQLTAATYSDIEPPHDIPRFIEQFARKPATILKEGAVGIYLTVPTRLSEDHEVMKYLVSGMPYPSKDGWPGNPIGNLAKGWRPPPSAFAGKAYVDDFIYTDKFYSSISAVVPLLNEDGSLLAFIGLDYAATKENHALNRIKYLSLTLLGGSLLLILFVSLYLAHRLATPLQKLQSAAQQITINNLHVRADIATPDEFGNVGKVFNLMITRLDLMLTSLTVKQENLSDGIWYLNKDIRPFLQEISRRTTHTPHQQATETLQQINAIARDGLSEVRLLMNSLDLEHFTLDALADELRFQSQEILRDTGHNLTVDFHDLGGRFTMPLREYLQLLHFFRQVLQRLAKDSGGCYTMRIADDDQPSLVLTHSTVTHDRACKVNFNCFEEQTRQCGWELRTEKDAIIALQPRSSWPE